MLSKKKHTRTQINATIMFFLMLHVYYPINNQICWEAWPDLRILDMSATMLEVPPLVIYLGPSPNNLY